MADMYPGGGRCAMISYRVMSYSRTPSMMYMRVVVVVAGIPPNAQGLVRLLLFKMVSSIF